MNKKTKIIFADNGQPDQIKTNVLIFDLAFYNNLKKNTI